MMEPMGSGTAPVLPARPYVEAVKEQILDKITGLLPAVGLGADTAQDVLALCQAWAALEYGEAE